MSKAEWQAYWTALKRKMDEKPCPDLAGLDLIRGTVLPGSTIYDDFHLQIFGQDPFLRNMFQHALVRDAGQNVPIIILASSEESELPEEAFKVLDEKTDGSPGAAFFYDSGLPAKKSAATIDYSEFLETGSCRFMFVKLNPEGIRVDKRMLAILEAAIKEHFDEGNAYWRPNACPLIYIFCPEALEPGYSILNFAKGLEDYVIFRIFSKEKQVLGAETASLIYGPDLYPVESYERMKKHCCRQFKEKSKWNNKHAFFGDEENQAVLKAAKKFFKNIPVQQTAFARLKTRYQTDQEYIWFYPVQQSLGKKPVERISSEIENKPRASADKPKPPRLQIVEDLRPKNQDSTKGVC